MTFFIIPHTAQELFSNFAVKPSLDHIISASEQFQQICILKKTNAFPQLPPDTSSCLFLFYELSDSSSSPRPLPDSPLLENISYVDVGSSCFCHILTMLANSCPDLYPILESQYRLFLTQHLLDALQNGYHSRMRDLLQSLSESLEKKFLIVDPANNQKASTGSSDFFQHLPGHSTIISYLDQTPVYQGKIFRKDMGICLILPVYRFGEIIEFLIVGNCSETPYPLFFAALKTVLSVLAIEYEMRQSVFTVVNRSRNGLMDAITNSGRLTPATISEWAGLLGFKSKRLYIVIYMDFIPVDNQKDPGLSAYYEILEFMIHYYHPDDYYFLRALPNSLYMIGQFPPDSPEQAQKKSMDTCRQIEHYLKTKTIIKQMYSGIGTTQQNFSDISKSYQNALKALQISHTTGESIICYETLGILRLLGNIPPEESVDDYIPESLKRLHAYDQKNHTSLVNTLETYYTSNCNAAEAAKRLFIHYKTMLNRLERISQILDCDYSDSHIRLEIEMGLQIMQIHKT